MAERRPRSRQAEPFARSKRSIIEIAPTHRLAMIMDEREWTGLEELVQEIRRRKLKTVTASDHPLAVTPRESR